MLAVDRICQMF